MTLGPSWPTASNDSSRSLCFFASPPSMLTFLLMQVLSLNIHPASWTTVWYACHTFYCLILRQACHPPPSIHRYIVCWFPVVGSTKWTSNKDTATSKGREIKIVKDKVGTDPGQEWTMDAFYKQRQDGWKQRSQVHFLSCLIVTLSKPGSQKTEMNTHREGDWGQGPSVLVRFLTWCCF